MSEYSAEALQAVLGTLRLGRRAIFYGRIGSTNDVALELAHRGAEDGLLVVADEQTAGRGRLDRSWWAPAGRCLLLSLLLRAPLPLRLAGQLTMCLGLGVVEAIGQVSGLRAQLKWPNDVLLNGRKLGGMLTELRHQGDSVEYAVLGLGLNVNIGGGTGLDSLPPALARTATSLLIETGRETDRLVLLGALLARTETWYERVLSGQSVYGAWVQHLDTLGRRVRIAGPTTVIVGIATGATAEGALLVRDDDGREHTVWSGDVVALRSAD